MTFDPNRLRGYLVELHIPMARQDAFADALTKRALEGVGQHIHDTCIECYLVGLFDVGRELFPKARKFLRAAIEHKEIPRYYFPGGTESLRLVRFAMCEWFVDRKHDLRSLKQGVEWSEQWLSRPGRPDKSEVQLTLTAYLDAEEYETLVKRFEATGLKAPRNLRQIQGEGTMSYVIARHRLGLQYTSDDIQDALDRFLKRNVPKWCDGGHVQTLARWMKIAFWKPGDDPIATLLKCYDYLPGIGPPEYRP
jgi:hypothetical protein